MKPIICGLSAKPVFMGSGLAAARRPGMTKEMWKI
jgi:hypothetical protein